MTARASYWTLAEVVADPGFDWGGVRLECPTCKTGLKAHIRCTGGVCLNCRTALKVCRDGRKGPVRSYSQKSAGQSVADSRDLAPLPRCEGSGGPSTRRALLGAEGL